MSTSPLDVLSEATEVADAFARIVAEQELSTRIHATDYIRADGWTLLAQMMGRSVGTAQTEPVTIGGVAGFRSRATVYGPDGVVEGHADGLCMRSERQWAAADDYAVAGMAQTRAISRALRERFGFIVALAGYAATPAEEIGPEPMFATGAAEAVPEPETKVTTEPAAKVTAEDVAAGASEPTADSVISEEQVQSLVDLATQLKISRDTAKAIIAETAGVGGARQIPLSALDDVRRAFARTSVNAAADALLADD